ncbi:MAG: hypothetical protein V3V13_10085 [Paracoccaceae bacterium]
MKPQDKEPALSDFFDALKDPPPKVTPELMARILDDAAAQTGKRHREHLWFSQKWQITSAIAASALLSVSAGYMGAERFQSIDGLPVILSIFSDDPLDSGEYLDVAIFETLLDEG